MVSKKYCHKSQSVSHFCFPIFFKAFFCQAVVHGRFVFLQHSSEGCFSVSPQCDRLTLRSFSKFFVLFQHFVFNRFSFANQNYMHFASVNHPNLTWNSLKNTPRKITQFSVRDILSLSLRVLSSQWPLFPIHSLPTAFIRQRQKG